MNKICNIYSEKKDDFCKDDYECADESDGLASRIFLFPLLCSLFISLALLSPKEG